MKFNIIEKVMERIMAFDMLRTSVLNTDGSKIGVSFTVPQLFHGGYKVLSGRVMISILLFNIF